MNDSREVGYARSAGPLSWETVKTFRDETSKLSVEVRRAKLEQKRHAFVYSIQVGGYQKENPIENRREKTTPYIAVSFDFERGVEPTLRHPVAKILGSMLAEAEAFIVEEQKENANQAALLFRQTIPQTSTAPFRPRR